MKIYVFVIAVDEMLQRGLKISPLQSARKKVEWIKRHSYDIAHLLVNEIISRRSSGLRIRCEQDTFREFLSGVKRRPDDMFI